MLQIQFTYDEQCGEIFAVIIGSEMGAEVDFDEAELSILHATHVSLCSCDEPR